MSEHALRASHEIVTAAEPFAVPRQRDDVHGGIQIGALDALDQLARQIEGNAVAAIGPRATGIQADSANLSDLNRLYERVKTEAGRIDVLFVNAGGGSMLPLGSITEEQYDDTFGRNVKGVLFTVQKVLPLLVDGGSVILTASNVSIKGHQRSASIAPRRPRCATLPEAGRST